MTEEYVKDLIQGCKEANAEYQGINNPSLTEAVLALLKEIDVNQNLSGESSQEPTID